MTCSRAREYLETKRIKIGEQVTANKAKYSRKEALALAGRVKRLIAAKGTKLNELDIRKKPASKEILELMLGPTGNLRAPTMRVGDTLYVGFPKGGFDGWK